MPAGVERSPGTASILPPHAELVDGGGEVGVLAAGDVDAGAGAEQAFGEHLADAAAASGDHGDFPGEWLLGSWIGHGRSFSGRGLSDAWSWKLKLHGLRADQRHAT